MLNIMSLNTQSGEHGGLLHRYLIECSETVDIICLQEVHHCADINTPNTCRPNDPSARRHPMQIKLYETIRGMVGYEHFHSYFAPQMEHALHDCERYAYPVCYGQALFVRNSLVVQKYESVIVSGAFNDLYNNGVPAARSMQVIVIRHLDAPFIIAHFHGLWHPDGKIDMPHRIRQSQNILRHLQRIKDEVALGKTVRLLLCGDFNYTSQMEAMRMLVHNAVFGMNGGVHLNEKHGVFDTRTKHYTKNVREADHVIVSPNLEKAHFMVDSYAPSDHAALFVSCL